MATVKIS